MAVELQLSLALPTALMTNPISFKGSLFDLNRSSSYSDDESDASTEFCGSSVLIHCDGDRSGGRMKMKKRSIDQASDSDCASSYDCKPTLPLLIWNKQPKDDDDLPNGDRSCNLTLIRTGVESEGIVGWPPIKTYRKKQRGQDRPAAVLGGRRGGGSKCVKAQIEGLLITRKIDLNLHQSFETLTSTLLFMFGRGYESVEEYNLTYQEVEGDWLLAADLPWRSFLESVYRLKLTRKEE